MSADRLGRELRIRPGTRLGTVISPVGVRSSFSWELIVNAKPLLRYCSEEPRSFQSGPLGPGASRVCSSLLEEWQEWVSKFMSGDSLGPPVYRFDAMTATVKINSSE